MKAALTILLGIVTGFAFLTGSLDAADAPALATSAVASAPAAVPPAATNPGPRIQFDATTFSFEKLKQGETIKHSFIFTNTGVATLEILEVKPGCGCTTAGQWDKTVEPGKTGAIPLQFNSTGFGGPVSKSASVLCNDPLKPNVLLTISGTVWRPIDISPTMAMFQMEAETQTNQSRVVRLVSNLDQPLVISNAICPNPAFRAELKEVKPGKEFEVEITAVAPFTNTAYATITLKTSAPEAPTLNITAYAVVQQPVVVSPQQIYLPAGALTNPVTQVVSVMARTATPLHVTNAALALPGVEVSIREAQTNRVFIVQAKFPVGFKLEASQRPELTVNTDHPKFQVIRVPVVQARVATAAAPPVSAAARLPTAALRSGSTDAAASPAPVKRIVPVRNPSSPVGPAPTPGAAPTGAKMN